MLKYAYDLGVKLAYEDAGLVKTSVPNLWQRIQHAMARGVREYGLTGVESAGDKFIKNLPVKEHHLDKLFAPTSRGGSLLPEQRPMIRSMVMSPESALSGPNKMLHMMRQMNKADYTLPLSERLALYKKNPTAKYFGGLFGRWSKRRS